MSKLSVLVAEKVMDWPTIDEYTPYQAIKEHGGYICKDVAERRIAGIMFDVFRPDTNISDAWKVVERITTVRYQNANDIPAMTKFGHWFNNESLWAFSAEQASKAICLAALRAIGMTDAEIGEALR